MWTSKRQSLRNRAGNANSILGNYLRFEDYRRCPEKGGGCEEKILV